MKRKQFEIIFTAIKGTLFLIFLFLLYVSFKKSKIVAETVTTVTEPPPKTIAWAAASYALRLPPGDNTELTPKPYAYCQGTRKKHKRAIADIPTLHSLILKKQMSVMITVGKELHYTFLAVTAGIHVHSFDNTQKQSKMKHLIDAKQHVNWDYNNLHGVSPFTDVMIIQEWQDYEHVLQHVFQECIVKKVIILDVLQGQCPSYTDFLRDYMGTPQMTKRYACDTKTTLGYTQCDAKI